ncbi:MAG: hypothetical protein ABH875_01770, partial [Candidatus Omnitrophota bacterium]
AGFTHVLLGIVHKEAIRKQFSVFERLNIYPDNIILGSFALVKFMDRAQASKEGGSETKACLDVDADFSDLTVFRAGDLLFSKNISMGAFDIDKPDNISRLASEVKQALALYQSEAKERVTKFFITGAEPGRLPKTSKKMREELAVDMAIIEPAAVVPSLRGIKKLDLLTKNMSISAVLGCAMDPLSKTLSFVLPEAKLKMDMRESAKNFIVTGSVGIFLMVLMAISFLGNLQIRQSYLDKLARETYRYMNIGRDSMEALDKIRAVRNFSSQDDSFLYYYYRFIKILPANITIERMIFSKKNEFSLVGRGTAMGEIWKFVSVLKDEGAFGKIELRYSRKKQEGDREFNEFEIVCHLGE